MKRIIALLLAAVMLATLAACTNARGGGEYDYKTMELSDIISATYKKKPISLSVSTQSLDLELLDSSMIAYYGVKSKDKVSQMCVSSPVMAPPAYEMVVVRVKDASDAEAMAREMLENADRFKWICVFADCVRIGVCGDTIMMVMSTVKEADGLISAFGKVCGGLDLTLEQ